MLNILRLANGMGIALILTLAACTTEPVQATKSVDPQTLACVAEAVYFEARGTGPEGLRAVAEVVVNRAEDPRFPATPCGVIDQRYNGSCQFSYRCDSIPNDKFNEPQAYARAQAVAAEVLSAPEQQITNGALFFHAASIPAGWFGTLNYLGLYGGNKFYR